MLAVINGVLVHRCSDAPDAIAIHPLPLIAMFYAVVSVHFQIPVYLYFTVGLSLASLLWLAPPFRS